MDTAAGGEATMNLTTDLIPSYANALAARMRTHVYGDGILVDLPWAFGDGDGMSVLVQPVGDRLYNISDRELTADVLAMAGVDLSHRAVRASWETIRATLDRPKPFGRDLDEFEIAAFVDDGELVQALDEIAAVMLRADGLRALGVPARRATFSQRVIRRVQRANLKVVPKAEVRTKFGGQRQVTAQVIGERAVYMQALGTSSMDAYDHARSLFGDAQAEPDQLVAVIAGDVKLSTWQRNALRQDATVVDEPDLDPYLVALAA
ncbi:hypothetical protein [Isoptericola sp. QY 916]|uniref:hypothetical protein n=1 Tax=Isoptericola sp. QY 916 TaxID=2782570 RepID=UPI003D2FBB82|nr:hypothetical protein [Isoptericola sp. QY 916]